MKESDQQVISLVRKFEKRLLTKNEWDHTSHLSVAIYYASAYGYGEALVRIRKNIKEFNESVGTPNSNSEGYHETITQFWLTTAFVFIEEEKFNSISQALSEFLQSPFSKREYPLEFYSKELLMSAEARHKWVKSDLKHFIPYDKLRT
ncbi:hypothetical protein [Ekhidna sp.]|uniref:hypothetical protein n=1 Tax=Ekhidna sp. TaxID=2608089 RepID=UPI003298169E